MGQSSSIYRLINANNQHNFIFSAELLINSELKVTLEAEDIRLAKQSVFLSKGEEKRIEFFATGATIYEARGSLKWDSLSNIVRFEGYLRLVNVAEIFMYDCPVLEIPQ